MHIWDVETFIARKIKISYWWDDLAETISNMAKCKHDSFCLMQQHKILINEDKKMCVNRCRNKISFTIRLLFSSISQWIKHGRVDEF